MRKRYCWIIGLLLAAVCAACVEDPHYSTDSRYRLTLEADTLSFDTLFTGVGSATGVLQVYNRNDVSLRLPSIRLAGGWSSPFRVNVDGQYGVDFRDVDLRANDSLFLFVEVTVDITEADSIFAVEDSLLFTLPGGDTQRILLTASGWNAEHLHAVTLHSDTTFTAWRPYVIYDSLVVDNGVTLTLRPGTRLFFHPNAYLSVRGTIKAEGTRDSLVVFRGDRIDRMFSYLPYDYVNGQWGGITLAPQSHDNVFTYCDIHSSNWGIRAGASDMSQPTLTLDGTQIHNIDHCGLDGTMISGSAVNCLFTNAGEHCVRMLGGQFDFIHCTIANFFAWSVYMYQGEAVSISNYDDKTVYPMLGINFLNCLITGRKDDELTGTVTTGSETNDLSAYAQYLFSHSLINTRDTVAPNYVDIVWESPDSTASGIKNFVPHPEDYQNNFRYDNFHLDTLSRARGIGDPTVAARVPYDRDGVLRDTVIDAGCYQFR